MQNIFDEMIQIFLMEIILVSNQQLQLRARGWSASQIQTSVYKEIFYLK